MSLVPIESISIDDIEDDDSPDIDQILSENSPDENIYPESGPEIPVRFEDPVRTLQGLPPSDASLIGQHIITANADGDEDMSISENSVQGSPEKSGREHGTNDDGGAGGEGSENEENEGCEIELHECPHTVGYREQVIRGHGRDIVIGAVDIAFPGRGVKTYTMTRYAYPGYQPIGYVDQNGYQVGGFFDVVAAPFKAVASVTTSAVKAVAKEVKKGVNTLEHLPVVGPLVKAVELAAPFNVISNIASGKNVGDSLVQDFKDKVKAIKTVAPYAQTVISFVPGVGTTVNAAIGAAAALAEGKSIDKALLEAARSALPGGPAAQAAFDAGLKIANGANVGLAALEAAQSQIPGGPAAKAAFNTAVALAHGKKLQDALAAAAKQITPEVIKGAAAIGAGEVAKLGKSFLDARDKLPAAAKTGFDTAVGIINHQNIPVEALSVVRKKLSPDLLAGFDSAVKLHAAAKTLNVLPPVQKLIPVPTLPSAKKIAAAKPKLPAPKLSSPVASAMAKAARTIVDQNKGLTGFKMNIPGASQEAVAAYAAASTGLAKLSEASRKIAEAKSLAGKLGGKTPTPEQAKVLAEGKAAEVVKKAGLAHIEQIKAKAAAGDPTEQKRLQILQAVNAAHQAGAGEHGWFVSSEGKILKGRFAPA